MSSARRLDGWLLQRWRQLLWLPVAVLAEVVARPRPFGEASGSLSVGVALIAGLGWVAVMILQMRPVRPAAQLMRAIGLTVAMVAACAVFALGSLGRQLMAVRPSWTVEGGQYLEAARIGLELMRAPTLAAAIVAVAVALCRWRLSVGRTVGVPLLVGAMVDGARNGPGLLHVLGWHRAATVAWLVADHATTALVVLTLALLVPTADRAPTQR